jgi:alanine dehydrogenase
VNEIRSAAGVAMHLRPERSGGAASRSSGDRPCWRTPPEPVDPMDAPARPDAVPRVDAHLPRFGSAALIDAARVRAFTPWAALVDRIERRFVEGAEVPLRHHHTISGADGASDGTLLLMPAWRSDGVLGVKVLQVAPDNASTGLSTLHSIYLLASARTGVPLAIIDGTELTVRRTAAVSALAARRLARPDVLRLLIVGSGRLAPWLAEAHASVRDYTEIVVWGRRASQARKVAAQVAAATGIATRAVDDLEAAVRVADVVSCATLSSEPLVRGAWLRPGTHVDLVGAFKRHMREADDDTIARADVWVDTIGGALAEGGELVQAIASGAIRAEAIRGDLRALCLADDPVRTADGITVFKSVGTALSDLAAAELIADAARLLEPSPADRGA